MSDSKIKFLTYDLLDDYGLIDPRWLDRNLESLKEEDVFEIFSKLREWYFNYQPQITVAAKTGNVLFNIAPKTFFRYPLANTPVFSLKSVLPFLPFSNRVAVSDPLLDAFNMSLKDESTIDLTSFKENVRKINEGMRIFRPFVEENVVLFYDFFLILHKDFINNTNWPILQSLDSEESLNDLLKVYEQDKTLLPVMESNVVIRNADGTIKSCSPAKGVFSTAGLKLFLRNYHLPEAIKGVVVKGVFESNYSSPFKIELALTKKLIPLIFSKEVPIAEDFFSRIPHFDIFSEGMLQPLDVLNLRVTQDDSIKIFQGALTSLFNKQITGDLIDDHNKLIKTEIEPEICKINLEANRIRSKYRNIYYQNIALSSLCFVGSLFGASFLNHPDPLKVFLEFFSLIGSKFNIDKLLDARINKKDELNKLKQDNFYLLWYATNSSKQL